MTKENIPGLLNPENRRDPGKETLDLYARIVVVVYCMYYAVATGIGVFQLNILLHRLCCFCVKSFQLYVKRRW